MSISSTTSAQLFSNLLIMGLLTDALIKQLVDHLCIGFNSRVLVFVMSIMLKVK